MNKVGNSALADEHLSRYIQNIAKYEPCSVGLILGQIAPSKTYVLHFAKTPQFHGQSQEKGSSKLNITSVNEINETWVAEHANHATRLLPGGIYVLGIFVVSRDDLLSPFSPKLKSILGMIHKQLGTSKYLKGNPDGLSEKLVLNYCTKTALYSCKTYDVSSTVVKPIMFKFGSQELNKWHEIECFYDLDQMVPIMENDKDLPLKKHMAVIMKSIDDVLQSAVFFYNGELYDADMLLEGFLRKKRGQKGQGLAETLTTENKPIEASIFVQCNNNNVNGMTKGVEIRNMAGHIKLSGQVGSKLWLHPKATVKEASEAIKEDLLRSLAARLEMHWDSLIEEEHGSPEDTNSIHEPPRRVLVTLPKSIITLSDYLFPGEGPQEAQISLQELLDIKVNEKDAIKDIEGQADLTDMYNEALEADSEETLPKLPTDTNKFMYMIGLSVALFVLIVSLIVHYLN